MRLIIIAFAFGVLLLQSLGELPGALWLLVFLPLFIALNSLHGLRARKVVLLAVAFCFGVTWAAMFAYLRLADSLPIEWESKDVEVIGTVATLPTFGEHGVRFGFDVERVLTNNAQLPAHVSLSWYAKDRSSATNISPVHPGERWQWTIRLKRPHGNANPHGFDFEAWLLEQNIRATGYVREQSPPQRLNAMVQAPSYGIERLREQIRTRLYDQLAGQPYAPIMVALAIGDQSRISQDQWDLFWHTGIGHLISISGLHVTMVSGLVFAIAYFLWRRSRRLTLWWPARKAATVAGLLAALGYATLAGMAIPTQRTLLMLAVFAVSLWLNRLTSPSRVLCAALLIVLLFDPWAVIAPGFWLSFAAVGLIFYVASQRSIAPVAGWRKTISNRVVQAGRMQWAVTIGLVPLLLGWFQQVSLISPVANALAIPLISFLVVPLILLGCIPGLDPLLQVAHGALSLGMHGLQAARDLPFGQWFGPAPSLLVVALGSVGIVWLLLPRGFPARWLGAILLLPLFVLPVARPALESFWVTTLDVGQGLAVVVQTKNHTLLYDTGPRYNSESDSGNRVIVPYLRAMNVRRLDGMVVSHNDGDHSGGALSVLRSMPVDSLVASLPDHHPIVAAAQKYLPCGAGQSWQWDGVRFDVLHPGPWINAATIKDNDRGCVVRVSSRFGSLLLPADIEQRSEAELVAKDDSNLKSTVLIAPHHGSKTSSSDEFLRAVQPQIVVVSAGYRNRFGHPKAEILDRYATAGAHVYRSDRDGAVTLRFDPSGLQAEAYRAQHQRYWFGR